MNGDAPEAVLLVAHGSRVAESNAQVESLAARLGSGLAPGQRVAHAFLDLTEPSIPAALGALARSGVEHVVLIPYFLAAGRHVTEDIPAEVEAARRAHPGLSVEITEHIGAQRWLPELLAEWVSNRLGA